MVALRDEGKLIGYYEKHEYRNVVVLCQDLVQVKMRNFSPFEPVK